MTDDEMKVSKFFGCPKCGNRDFESLEWMDDQIVACLICHTRYEPLSQTVIFQEPGSNGQRQESH